MTMSEELPLPFVGPSTVWFAPYSYVVRRGDVRDVFAGGLLVGSIGPKDVASRNVLLAALTSDPGVHLGQLALAFGLSEEGLRKIRRVFEEQGLEALIGRKRAGRKSDVKPSVRRELEKLFAKGASVSEAFAAVGKRAGSRATVGRVLKQWAASRPGPTSTEGEEVTGELAIPAVGELRLEVVKKEDESAAIEPPGAETTGGGDDDERKVLARSPQSVPMVQHAGAWLLVAAVNALGMYEQAFATAAAAKSDVSKTALRLALDAVVVALGIGERCIEGVRRLATASASALLLASHAPSAPWVRQTLGRFAQDHVGAAFHLRMARTYVEAQAEESGREGPVFYVDNHLRKYSGKHTVRRGWRMQDKRVRPGASDYYVHDEDGRPVGRITAPQHGALTDFLSPIAYLLRLALPKENILLAFDRAGAFPSQLAALRDDGFECVTYERRPYALLPTSAFTETVVIDGERLRLFETRKNLKGGRGRVRRIAVLTEDGRQMNLLAVSKRPARRLLEVMRGRWNQENGFKHGNERWGINQLDGRTVVPYPEDTFIPNPARRRLDEALRIARVREGLVRAQLARLRAGDSRREQLDEDIVEAMAEQKKLEAQRPSTPTHAELKDTELAGKLVHHELEYKLVIDTIRIACANAESDLATALAPLLPHGDEAKKALANLFGAPGRVHVGPKTITVTLQPAGTNAERNAFGAFFRMLNQRHLALPGDQTGRALRFCLHQLQ